MLKVNLACGNTFVCRDNWLNLDYSSLNSSVLQANILGRLPINNNSADLVYSSHFLEHIPRDKVGYFLLECWRILQPGGVLRLVVPDLENLCRTYLYHRDQADDIKADFVVLELLDQCVRRRSGGELGRYYQSLKPNDQADEARIAFVRERTGEDLKQSPPPPQNQRGLRAETVASPCRAPLDPRRIAAIAKGLPRSKREPGRLRRTPSLALRHPSAPAVVDCQQLRGNSALYCGHQPLHQLSFSAARPGCRWASPQGSRVAVYRSAEAPVAPTPWFGRHG
jgi:SAM-dependent methyltransferase